MVGLLQIESVSENTFALERVLKSNYHGFRLDFQGNAFVKLSPESDSSALRHFSKMIGQFKSQFGMRSCG
jgi:hypothetical protein